MKTEDNRLRQQRRSREIGQRQLAKESGIPQRTISRLENGCMKDPDKAWAKLADTLGVTPKELKGEA